MKKIMHWFTFVEFKYDKCLGKSYRKPHYLCNRACGVTRSKLAATPYSVTCKNCLKKLAKYLY